MIFFHGRILSYNINVYLALYLFTFSSGIINGFISNVFYGHANEGGDIQNTAIKFGFVGTFSTLVYNWTILIQLDQFMTENWTKALSLPKIY